MQEKITKCSRKHSILLFLFVALFFSSCSGQDSTSKSLNANNVVAKKYEHPTIVRTMGVQSANVICEMLDKEGNLWFSIRGEGAYRYDGKSFTNYTTSNGLCSNHVESILQDRAGNILFGTSSGICMYDGSAFTKYPISDTFNITCMLEDKEGNLWFGAMNNGVYRYDGQNLTNFINSYNHPMFGNKQEKLIIDIMQDQKGNIWFSSWNRGGVWRYDGKILTHFLPPAEYYSLFEDARSNAYSSSDTKYVHSPDYITDDMIFSISEDRAGNIWFATRRHGVCRFDGKSFTSFSENEAFVKHGIYSIFEDKKGNLWFSTDKNGVYRYDGKTLYNYTTANGLVNNSVFSILEDKGGNLWFGTRWFGLSRFDGISFTTFSQHDFDSDK